jgi:hypothetical protein
MASVCKGGDNMVFQAIFKCTKTWHSYHVSSKLRVNPIIKMCRALRLVRAPRVSVQLGRKENASLNGQP